MPRTDRLQSLLARLRDGRLHRAEDLARAFGVSQRTIYRDIELLQASGLPVAGTKGAGYRMTAPVALPPLDLTLAELEALHLGLAVVAEAADPELKAAATRLADRIDAALPPETGGATPAWPGLATHPLAAPGGSGISHLPALRAAIRTRQKLRLRDGTGADTLRPLALDYRGRLWWLTAWSEEKGAFRTIRLDRVAALDLLPKLFVDEPGKSLDDLHG